MHPRIRVKATSYLLLSREEATHFNANPEHRAFYLEPTSSSPYYAEHPGDVLCFKAGGI